MASPYFAVRWRHDSPHDPALLFEELNEQRLETRKVEQYADGSRIWSDRIAPALNATLSWEPIPSEADIDSQQDFTVEPLTAEEFEVVWARRPRRSVAGCPFQGQKSTGLLHHFLCAS